MAYVGGFICAVPTANREEYKKHVRYSAAVFKDHGATKVVESWWIMWPSKEAREAGMKKVLADKRMKPGNNPMPFDGKRLIYGGFDILVEM